MNAIILHRESDKKCNLEDRYKGYIKKSFCFEFIWCHRLPK